MKLCEISLAGRYSQFGFDVGILEPHLGKKWESG